MNKKITWPEAGIYTRNVQFSGFEKKSGPRIKKAPAGKRGHIL
jgi:hypothetical protein